MSSLCSCLCVRWLYPIHGHRSTVRYVYVILRLNSLSTGVNGLDHAMRKLIILRHIFLEDATIVADGIIRLFTHLRDMSS